MQYLQKCMIAEKHSNMSKFASSISGGYSCWDDGKPFRHSILGGRAQIVKFERQPDVFVYRQLLSGSKSYYHQQLTASDDINSLREAEELSLSLQNELEVDDSSEVN